MLILLTIFGGMVPVFGMLMSYWRRSHVKVNCWFCGLNTRVLKQCEDGWFCKHCEQYNGFKPDGDYNRDIPAQWNLSLNNRLSFCSKPQSYKKFSSNGLCEECNRNQEMKVAQLASFQPINPDNFDNEIENFSYHLERAYRLCSQCEAVLEETLSQKKTHVLDMNLQMTGKNSEKGKKLHSKLGFKNCLNRTTSFLTTVLAFSVLCLNILLLLSDPTVSKYFGSLDNGEVLPRLSSYPASLLSFLTLGPSMCPHQETVSPPEESSKSSPCESLSVDPLLIQTYMLPISLACLAIQGISSFWIGFQPPLCLWLAFAGTVLFQNNVNQNYKFVKTCQIFEIVLTILILLFSWKEACNQKPKLSLAKRLKRDNSTHSKRCSERFDIDPSSNIIKPNAQAAPQNFIQSALLRTSSQGKFKHDSASLDSSKYLNLPSRPSSVASHRTLTSASGLLDNSAILPSVDALSTLSQDDTRSDASVDSAFSNPDSISLDAADSFNGSYQFSSGKKIDRQGGDVQSLIEGLSIGPISRQSSKKSSEFKTKSYVREQKRSSLLTPAKLTNIMNESAASGIWHNSHSSNQLAFAAEQSKTMSRRPGSYCESIHSHATVTPSSFQPITPAWNPVASPTSLNMLSVAVPSSSPAANSHFGSSVSPAPSSPMPHYAIPPHTIASNPGFGTAISPVPNSPLSGSGVMYTPYGVFHQLAGPYGNPIFMMQHQSPTLSSRSPSSSFESHFSPQSFSTSSQKDCNSFYDSDCQSSPKSNRTGMKTKSLFSSSFTESVWQSRFAILYTTLCYLLLGTVVYFFSYGGFATSIFTKVINWKDVLSSMMT